MNYLQKMSEIQAKVKSELGVFMGNQQILLKLSQRVQQNQSSPNHPYYIDALNKLQQKQSSLESSTFAWLSEIGDLKATVESNPVIAGYMRTGRFSGSFFSQEFWKSVNSYIRKSIPLINKGISVSGALISQNGNVALLKKSVEKGTIIMPSSSFNALSQSMIIMYGLLGVSMTYYLSSKKKRVR